MQYNLDDIGGAKELAKYRISVAKEDLEAAEINFEGGHYRSSNNRAYLQKFGLFCTFFMSGAILYRQHRLHFCGLGGQVTLLV